MASTNDGPYSNKEDEDCEREYPSLYDEVTEVSYLGVLVSGLTELRRLAREGKTTTDDILTLPYTGEQLKEFWRTNKDQIHGKMREKDFIALESILEGEDKKIDKILDQGALHVMGDDKANEECVYCITTNPLRKRIVVTFRGSITVQDWLQDTKMLMGELPNPLAGEEGQPDTVLVHAGFREYLYNNAPSIMSTTIGHMVDATGKVVQVAGDSVRSAGNAIVRTAESTGSIVKSAGSTIVNGGKETKSDSVSNTDTKSAEPPEETALAPDDLESADDKKSISSSAPSSLTKISESIGTITNKITGKSSSTHPAEEKEPSKVELILTKVQAMLDELDDYTVYIAGHSLGGALSLIFAMEAAATLRTSHPVTVFSLGNPRTGNIDFRHVICSLEEKRMLRCLCIHNEGDLVPKLPEILSTCCYLCVFRREGTFRHVGIKMKISEKDMSLRYHTLANESFQNDMVRQRQNIWGALKSVMHIRNCCSPSKSHSVARHFYQEYVLRLQKLEYQLKDIYLDDLYKKAYAANAAPSDS